MKVVIPIFFMYSLLGIVFYNIITDVVGLCFFITYILFSITYFRKTFIPYVINWFKMVINDPLLMEKMRKDKSMSGYIGFIGNFYISSQNNSSKLFKIVNKISYFAFLLMPFFVYVHYILYKQIKSTKE
jgi:hypothetical protein